MAVLKIIVVILLILAVAITILIAYARYRLHHVKDKGDLQASLNKQVQKHLNRQRAYGVAVGVCKDGRCFTEGYGSLQKDKQIPPDEHNLFELASTSKLFTTCLLQILCDKGKVHLDDKIADLLRNQVTLPPIASHTTVRQLATHTSGFPRLPQYLLDKMKDETNPYKDLTQQDLYNYLKTCTGKKKEGVFEYSNFGMGLLGHILGLIADSDYEQAVKKELLQPLGMKNTTVTINSEAAQYIAQGYDATGNPAPIWTDNVLTGAGSFLSNIADVMLFIRANIDEMHPLYPMLSKTHPDPLRPGNGLGWLLPGSDQQFMGNNAILWHNGMAGGYASFLAIDKGSKTGIILLSNKSVDVTGLGNVLMRVANTQSWKD